MGTCGVHQFGFWTMITVVKLRVVQGWGCYLRSPELKLSLSVCQLHSFCEDNSNTA